MIDITSLNIVSTSINAAKELTKAAVGLRDFNQVAATISDAPSPKPAASGAKPWRSTIGAASPTGCTRTSEEC